MASSDHIDTGANYASADDSNGLEVTADSDVNESNPTDMAQLVSVNDDNRNQFLSFDDYEGKHTAYELRACFPSTLRFSDNKIFVFTGLIGKDKYVDDIPLTIEQLLFEPQVTLFPFMTRSARFAFASALQESGYTVRIESDYVFTPLDVYLQYLVILLGCNASFEDMYSLSYVDTNGKVYSVKEFIPTNRFDVFEIFYINAETQSNESKLVHALCIIPQTDVIK